MSEENKDEKALTAWNTVMRAALSIPGAKIHREAFIFSNFSKYVSREILDDAVKNGTGSAGISIEIMDKAADGVIKFHTMAVTAISAAAGVPGVFAMIGTIPGDIAQFYYQTIQVAQKLAYIYGWGDLGEEEVSDEYIMLITLFLGVMSGAKTANTAITQMAGKFAAEIAKRLPKQALTKYGLYNVAKQVAKWMGVSLTKVTLSRGLSKIIPLIGGLISGAVSFASFLPMALKLKKHLRDLPIARGN